MINEMERASDGQTESQGRRLAGRAPTKWWIAAGIAVITLGGAWFKYSHGGSERSVEAHPAPLPQVVVSRPLVRELDTRIGFLGQLSAINQVELRAQVGGTLTGIFFKDGDIVHAGALLFTVESRQYEIKLAEAIAQLDVATARLSLADQQLGRARELERGEAGTVENVDQRTSDQRTAQASVEDAKAQVRDAQFDLEHCRITAPFTGRIGTHLVSVGSLIAGSRTATSPTTLLATLVSLDPIHLDFDMSESDFLAFSKHRSLAGKGRPDEKIDLSLGDEDRYTRQGVLDFLDNTLDRSSGTIHARATVRNPDLSMTPGEFTRVRVIVAAPAPTLLVPDAAVLPDQSLRIVMTVSANGVVTPKPVVTGEMREGLRVIQSGLDSNDRVVIDGLPYAVPGAKVTTQDGEIRLVSSQK